MLLVFCLVASLSLANLGLGSGCSSPIRPLVGFVRRLFPGRTIYTAGGDSVAPDLVPSRWYVWAGVVVASAWVAMAFAAPLSSTGAWGM